MSFTESNYYNLPVLPLRGLVVFPKTLLHFDVVRDKSRAAINIAMKEDQLIFLVAQKNPAVKDPDTSDLFNISKRQAKFISCQSSTK